jgi:hypothetical protein
VRRHDANIFQVQDESIVLVAARGQIASPPTRTRAMDRRSVPGRAVVDRRTIHIHDLAAESDAEYPISKAPSGRSITARRWPPRSCARAWPSARS